MTSQSGFLAATTATTEDDGMPLRPPDAVQYSQVPRTGYFTSTKTPKGLLKSHTTKAGTWGVINIHKGRLLYTIEGNDDEDELHFELSETRFGIIQPQQLHRVKPLTDDLEFVVEFHRLPGTGPVDEQREGL